MAQRPPKAPSDPQNYDPTAPHDGDGPRGRRETTAKTIRWEGVPLVPVDDTKEPKNIPPDATVGVKVELMGWGAAGEVPKGKLKRNAPLDVVSDTFTADDLHRLYGHGDYFCQAYTLSPTRGLQSPLGSKVWHLLPCEFNDPDDENDPEEEEDDVGEAAWPGMDAFKENEPTLRKEMRRRATIRREIAGGESRDRDHGDDEFGNDEPPRGFRDRDRGGMRGRGGSSMGGRRPMQDDPDWMFDPHTRPTAPCPPGLMWSFGGNPMKWFHAERTAEAVAAAAVPMIPAEKVSLFSGMDPDLKGLLVGVLAGLAKKFVTDDPAPKTDPTLATIQALGALNKPADPLAIEQLRIDAEDRRAATALAAENARIERENARIAAATEAAEKQRKHDAEVATAQRAHDAKLESDRRDAMAREAVAAEDRAAARAVTARNDLIALERMGLTGSKGPTPAEAAAAADMAVLRAQIQWMQSAPKTPDVMESFDKAKSMLTKLGLKVGDGEDKAGALFEALNTPAATAMATAIGPGINALFLKFAGASEAQAPLRTQVAVQPTPEQQAQIDAFIRAKQEEAYRAGLAEAEHRAQLAAQQAQQPPAAEPAPVQWVAVEVPAAPEETPVVEQPAPEPETPPEAPVEVAEEAPQSETVAEPVAIVEEPTSVPDEAPAPVVDEPALPVETAPEETPAEPTPEAVAA